MKLIGNRVSGDHVDEVGANYKRVARFLSPPVPARIVKLTLWADGLGSGVGDQVVRGIIYDTFGVLLGVGDEVVVRDGQPADWIDLRFSAYPNGVPLAPNTAYDFGVLAGEHANTMRVYGAISEGV